MQRWMFPIFTYLDKRVRVEGELLDKVFRPRTQMALSSEHLGNLKVCFLIQMGLTRVLSHTLWSNSVASYRIFELEGTLGVPT